MFQKIRQILGREYRFLNTISINKQNLIDNYHYLASLNSALQIAPVLKSNAYGHGIEVVGKILEQLHPPFLAVDSLHEAYRLTKAGVKTPILITGYIHPHNLELKKLPYDYAIFNLEMAEAVAKYQPEAGVHIFVDTGMHREGIALSELDDFLAILQQNYPKLNIVGIISHFAAGDEPKNPLTVAQVKNLKKALLIFGERHIYPKWVQMDATTGLLCDPKLQVGNLARVGRAIYGISPIPGDLNLKPVLGLTTHLAQIKSIKKGDKVGYSFTYTASKNMTIGILPIGYHDGVDRRLSNIGTATIDGIECPIIGRISMNITTIDISKVQDPKLNQEVVVYSANPKDKNSIQNVAKLCKTIDHEILSHLDPSTKRVII